jgi:inosine-uridine nucleoside N-ribohydrolase
MNWSLWPGRGLVAAAMTILFGACAVSPGPSAQSATPVASLGELATAGPALATAGPTPAPPARTPVIVDTDMGADDLMALLYLLRDPTVDVRAILVSGTGLAHSSNGAQIVSDVLGALGAEGIPLGIGDNTPMTGTRAFPDAWRAGADAGFGLALAPVPMAPSPAVELLSSVIRSSAVPVTILTLGPLTDLGQALSAEPTLAPNVARVQVSGGAIDVPGNVASEGGDPAATAAEWNLWIDPAADDIVLGSGIPVMLVPLDATEQLPLGPSFREALANDHVAAGADIAYELIIRNESQLAGTFFWDQLATVLLTNPAVASLSQASVTVITDGAASGSLEQAASGRPVSYAVDPDAAGFQAAFLEGLRRGPPRSDPFTLTGTLHGVYDGSTCGGAPSGAVALGTYGIDFENTAAGDVGFAVIHLHAGATWQELIDFAAAVGPNNADTAPPDFVDVSAFETLSGPGIVRAIVSLTPGTYGFACVHSAGPSVTLSAPFEVGD